MALAGMAEPLGFDSLWSLEHHFTGYSMIPNPVQFLTYFAAHTSRIQLGTAVVVLPWDDPGRGAEGNALLCVMAGGPRPFWFGRGGRGGGDPCLSVARGGIAACIAVV